jgi:ankyrin repeat protein
VFLLRHHCDPNAVTKDLWTPLHLAAKHSDLAAVAAQLVEAGANVNAQDSTGR